MTSQQRSLRTTDCGASSASSRAGREMPAGSVGSCKPLSLSWRLLHHSSLILSLIGSSLVSDEPLWEGREDNSLGQQKAFMQKPNAEASSERAALGGHTEPLAGSVRQRCSVECCCLAPAVLQQNPDPKVAQPPPATYPATERVLLTRTMPFQHQFTSTPFGLSVQAV